MRYRNSDRRDSFLLTVLYQVYMYTYEENKSSCVCVTGTQIMEIPPFPLSILMPLLLGWATFLPRGELLSA